jgi:hypothetical protein
MRHGQVSHKPGVTRHRLPVDLLCAEPHRRSTERRSASRWCRLQRGVGLPRQYPKQPTQPYKREQINSLLDGSENEEDHRASFR